MRDDHSPSANRRQFLAGMGVTGELIAAPAHGKTGAGNKDAALRDKIETIVVICQENRSFNNLFAHFPGLAEPKGAPPPQRDRDGTILPHLPPVWGGMVPTEQVVEHAAIRVAQGDLTPPANVPYALRLPDGDPLPLGVVTRDLVHKFYENQMQINGGRNDGFAAWGNSGGLTMGHYDQARSQLRLWQVAREFTLCDRFFMGAFGGSFLNHQYLAAACPPTYPDAGDSPAAGLIARLEDGPTGTRLRRKPDTPRSALDGPAAFVESNITPDGFAVNTMLPPFAPTQDVDPVRPGHANPRNPMTLPPQHHATIGDRLSDRHVNWAWYGGGWQAALAGSFQDGSVPPRPNFQPHHQPFNYFARFTPGAADRDRHLRDGGIGDTARTNRFLADAASGQLPAVCFYKPQGNLTMHAGYSDVEAGDRHVCAVIDALRQSPQWGRMMVIVTFDENGGWWDPVAPPKGDRWGPGNRVPTLVVSPHARKGHVEHTMYDTGSILRLLTRRFGLEPLPGIVARDAAMRAAGGAAPGDLVETLDL